VKCSSRNRCHHLIKTFYVGLGGWTDQQMPDGTVLLTAPTGHTYAPEPHGASMFPALAQSTGELPETTPQGTHPQSRCDDAAAQANPRTVSTRADRR